MKLTDFVVPGAVIPNLQVTNKDAAIRTMVNSLVQSGNIKSADAEGIVAAVKEMDLQVPLVVRLAGTNVELGKDIFAKSELPIIYLDDLAEAAYQIVKSVKEAA